MSTEAPTMRARWTEYVEIYGMAAVATILVLFAIEMVVLVPLVRYGVDVSSWLSWAGLSAGEAPTSWWAAAGIAYAITRGLKPVQLVIAIALTPFVARWMPGRPGVEPPSDT